MKLEIYTLTGGAAEMLLHRNEKVTIGKIVLFLKDYYSVFLD